MDTMTSREVLDQIIVPSTENGTKAYVEMLTDDLKGPHQFYISHAWAM